MRERRVADLKRLELRLLEERTALLLEQERLLREPAWAREQAEALAQRHDVLRSELSAVREAIRRLEEGGG